MTTIDAVSDVYDAVSTTLATGSTNIDMAGTTALFDNVSTATYCSITTDQTITIRFNSTSNPGIIMTSSESPKRWNRAEQGLKIKNMFITNASGSTATMKIELYS